MDKSFDTARARKAGYARRRLDMHGIKGCAAAFDVKADGIDYTIGVKERRRYRGLVTDVSFRRLGFRIWSGCRSNPLGVARCCPHLEAVVKQMTDDPATENPVPPKTVMSPRWPAVLYLRSSAKTLRP